MATGSNRARRLAAALAFSLAGAPGHLWAQPAGPPVEPAPSREIPLAEQLFQEAKRLLDEGRVSEACPKFVESQRLDPGGGTLMNVARCHRLDGKLASAWAAFEEARAGARRDGRADRESEADAQIKELLPLLSYLTIVVPPEVAGLRGLELRRNDGVLGQAVFGSTIPVDAGLQTISVRAEGYLPSVQEVRIDRAGNTTVTVPMLEPVPERKPTFYPLPYLPPRPPPPPRGTSAVMVTGYVIGATGIVTVILGVAAGGVALSAQSDANALCPGTVCDDQEAVDLNGDARTAATLANIGIFGGGALVGLGIVLIVASASDDAVPVSASPGGASFRF